jgi:pheromone shutdown protein TraB
MECKVCKMTFQYSRDTERHASSKEHVIKVLERKLEETNFEKEQANLEKEGERKIAEENLTYIIELYICILILSCELLTHHIETFQQILLIWIC